MIVLQKAFIIPVFYLSCFVGHALDLTKVNLAYQYDVYDSFNFFSRITQAEGQLNIYYTLESDSLSAYQQFFLVQNGYESKAHDSLSVYTLDTLSYSGSAITCKLSFSLSKKNLLLITLVNTNQEYFRIYDVSIASVAGFPSFVPLDEKREPVLKNYVSSSKVKVSGVSNAYHIFRYKEDFGPADPAMGITKQIAPRLDIDSSFYIAGQLSGLANYYFYLIQSDTLDNNGVTLLKCPSYYPEYRKLEELIEPLIYITTPNENKALQNQMTREAFENFWLNTYGTKFRAKNAIRVFYDKVEQANLLFTDYKQGWKTDRGMIYVIFGSPVLVLRSDRSEIWTYSDGVEFEFIRISTLFTPSLYSLKRNKKYEELWYDQVGSIRKGL